MNREENETVSAFGSLLIVNRMNSSSASSSQPWSLTSDYMRARPPRSRSLHALHNKADEAALSVEMSCHYKAGWAAHLPPRACQGKPPYQMQNAQEAKEWHQRHAQHSKAKSMAWMPRFLFLSAVHASDATLLFLEHTAWFGCRTETKTRNKLTHQHSSRPLCMNELHKVLTWCMQCEICAVCVIHIRCTAHTCTAEQACRIGSQASSMT